MGAVRFSSFPNSGPFSGLTVSANGGTAGDAWPEEAPGGFPGQRHGPGGGGGGGVILLSGAPAAGSVAGGSNGSTDTVQDSYGATPGQAGTVVTTHFITETPRTQSGAYCAGADLAVTNSSSPAIVLPGANYYLHPNGDKQRTVRRGQRGFQRRHPGEHTFQSINTVAGWTCMTP